MRIRSKVCAAHVLLLCSRVAAGCPLCHTVTGAQVRAGIFNESFALNVLAAVAPFAVFSGVVALLYGDWHFVLWDLLFLASGVLFLFIGGRSIRAGRSQ